MILLVLQRVNVTQLPTGGAGGSLRLRGGGRGPADEGENGVDNAPTVAGESKGPPPPEKKGELSAPAASTSASGQSPSASAPAAPAAAMVWSKGSWVRFRLGDADEGGAAPLGMPKGLCSPYPSVSGLAVTCDLQAIEQRGAGAFPLIFGVEVMEGITVHEAKCTAGCSRADYAASIVGGGDGQQQQQRQSFVNATDKTLVGPFGFTVGTVSIPNSAALSGKCAAFDQSSCLIHFDLLVSYVAPGSRGGTPAAANPSGDDGGADKLLALPPVCFLSVGDWGSAKVKPVADQMAIDARRHFAKFIVSTGDNFYPVGVKSLNDPHWEHSFERPFSSPFLKHVRWYICAGNHDQWGLQPQLQYGHSHPRWYFPSLFYNDEMPLYESLYANTTAGASEEVSNDGGKKTATVPSASIFFTVLDYNGRNKHHQMAFLDTVHGEKYTTLSGGLSSTENRAGGGGSNNADAAIATKGGPKRKYLWKGVINHPLLFGGAYHGQHAESAHNRAQLKPIIDKHRIHFHLSGHDHVLEVLRSDGTDYFISGAGGGSAPYTSTRVAETVWWQGEGVQMLGYMRHCVYGRHKMTTTLIDHQGTEHYTHVTLYDN